MGALAPAFLAGLAAIAIPVLVHLIHRERKETVAFPSLMFLRKVPYRSVRRQKIRHLLLLALRCLAIIIVVSAFARPFLRGGVAASAGAADGRDVVVLLDRSYSMGYGTRWERALAAVRTVASQIRPTDRVSLVTFGSTAAQLAEPSNTAARVEAALASLTPTSEPTRFATGFRMAAQILGASDLPRREIVLVSDFHRFGWNANDEVTLPARTSVRTVDVSRGETEDIAVSGVAVARRDDGTRARATVTARATNLGSVPRTVDATLELDGRRVETRRVSVPSRSAAQVVFASLPVTAAATRAAVRITPDSQPANDAFFFTIAAQAGAGALIVQPPRPRQNQSLFLSRALDVSEEPPVRVTVTPAITAENLRDRTLIVMNETELPSGAMGRMLRDHVSSRGAILLVVPGERGSGRPAPEWQAVLPATIGEVVDRPDGARWTSVDFSHALFESFRAARADFSSVTATRYRALSPAPGTAVIARLDDGAPVLVERALGDGRIMTLSLTIDAHWTDLPYHPLWVPLVHQLARRSLAGSEARAWFHVPHVLDLSREGSVLVEAPSGARTRVGSDSGVTSVELRERGFYEVRRAGTAIGAGRPVAVNVELAESDLSHFDAAELVAAVTSRPEHGAPARAGTDFSGTAEELERRQALWWYLLLAALVLLAGETLLANRMSRRAGPVMGATQ